LFLFCSKVSVKIVNFAEIAIGLKTVKIEKKSQNCLNFEIVKFILAKNRVIILPNF
jgi:hypothetical protein